MNNYVYSTLANDQNYHVFKTENFKGVHKIIRSIYIKGKAGIANKHLFTPLGAVTNVSDEDLALLEKDEVFQTHKKNGYIVVRSDKVDPEVAVADNMNARDISAPVVPEDSNPEDDAQPVIDNVKSNKKAFVPKKLATVKNSFN